MTKDVRRALLVARRMFADGGDTATTTVAPGDSAFSGFFGGKSGKSGEATVAKPADKPPLQEPLPATTINYQNLMPPGMGMITPASAPGGGLPNVPGFMAGPSGFGSLVPAQASLTAPFSGVTGAPNLGAPTPSVGASGGFNPSLAQATFNYAPAAAVPKLIEPTTNPFAPSATTAADAAAKNVYEPIEGSGTTSESDGPGSEESRGGSVGFASGGHVGHVHVMDPHYLPGIHVRTAHTFSAGGTADDQDEGEGFDAYHGSPHAFEKFDPSKIGTGEGAQAYGHGMYFAGHEPVAAGYAVNPEARYARLSGHMNPKEEFAHDVGTRREARDWDVMQALVQKYGSNIDFDQAHQLAQKAVKDQGHLYHVRIKANPEHFLDWDAPLSEQQKLLPLANHIIDNKLSLLPEEKEHIAKNGTGADLYRAMVNDLHAHGASDFLHGSGIPGIKYWDAGSRAQGQGTRNYVIFNPDIIHVKRRYADGGLIQDKYPTHYMPNVGRQVMADGGDPGSDPMVQKAMRVAEKYKNGGRSASPEQVELQRRMKLLLHPEHEDPEVAKEYHRVKNETYGMPTHERGAYSDRILPMPAHAVSTTIAPMGNVTPKTATPLSWNQFYKIAKGGTLFTLGGDRSNLGRLTHINGKPLAWPVDLHAGTKYMTEPNPGAVWANDTNAATTLRNYITEARKYGPVYGAFAPMSPKSVDSSVNMLETLMAQIPSSGISKKDAKAFDDSLKAGAHIKGNSKEDIALREKVKKVMENWPGILNPKEAADFIKHPDFSGKHRGAIVKYMEMAPWQKAGFPSVGVTRAAITDPELMSTPGNMMGHHLVELSPDPYDIKNLAFEHSTYPVPTGGKLVGKLPFVERHIAQPDAAEKGIMYQSVIKETGEPTIIHPYSPNFRGRQTWGKFTEQRPSIQPINERMLESIQQAHGSDFADGGDVGFNPQPIRQAKAARKPTQTPDAILRALALSRSITKGT